MAKYEFVTIWQVEAPLASVWNLIYHSDAWPSWWKGVRSVELVKKGNTDAVGRVYRYTWKSKLPYRLTFDMQLTRVEPMAVIEGAALGELSGTGRWRLTCQGNITTARYDWQVETTKPWMNVLTPVARPIFKWNHNVVMNWGAEGLAKRLGAKLIQA